MKQIVFCSIVFLCFFAPQLSLAETARGMVIEGVLHQLSLPLNGVVKNVSVSSGESVKKGQELLNLDCRIYELQYKLASARLQAHAIVTKQALKDLERMQEMYDQDLVPEVEMQQMKDLYAQTDAENQEVKTEQSLANLNRSYCSLKAPFAGRVLSMNTNVGDVIAGQYNPKTLLTLLVPGSHHVEFTDASNRLFLLGQSVTVKVDGKSLSGVINRIDHAESIQHLGVSLSGAIELTEQKEVIVEY